MNDSPTTQGLHCRSELAVAVTLSAVPGVHVVCGTHLLEPGLALKVPLAHGRQVTTGEAHTGGVGAKVPGGQASHTTSSCSCRKLPKHLQSAMLRSHCSGQSRMLLKRPPGRGD